MPFSRDVKKILALYTSLDTLYEETSIYGNNKVLSMFYEEFRCFLD